MTFGPFILSSGAVLVAAIMAACLGYHFNRRLMASNQQWEKNRHLILSGEKFCDELLRHVAIYQQTDSPDVKAQILLGPIHISIKLITEFVQENFTHDDNMKHISKRAAHFITFCPLPGEPSNHDWVTLTAGTIIKLRFAFSDAQLTHSP